MNALAAGRRDIGPRTARCLRKPLLSTHPLDVPSASRQLRPGVAGATSTGASWMKRVRRTRRVLTTSSATRHEAQVTDRPRRTDRASGGVTSQVQDRLGCAIGARVSLWQRPGSVGVRRVPAQISCWPGSMVNGREHVAPQICGLVVRWVRSSEGGHFFRGG
jgi:hypothetical protein